MERTLDRTPAASWLLLASPTFAQRLAVMVPEATFEVAANPTAFLRRLDTDHPRLAVTVAPPADAALIRRVGAAAASGRGLSATLLNEPDAVEERLTALRGGFQEALSLATAPAEIAGRLRILAERAAPEDESRFAVADGTELDLAAHHLVRDGIPVPLRPKEFALLAVLVGRPGRVFTRRELHDRVWGADIAASRRVDVHVRWLRLKAEPEPDRPRHLVTVRRVGYRFDPPRAN